MNMSRNNKEHFKQKLQADPRYDYDLDLSNENSSHTKILRLVDKGKDVLEIGCATGYMTRYLKEELGCRVFCIEIDPKPAQKARSYCEELLIGDIEQLDLNEAIGDRRFDVVILADVLEHLKDSRSVLKKLRHFLGDTGYILLSIPNGAHGSIALELLDGKWEYRSQGLLDRTHLHFFDKDGFTTLLDETGYLISQLERVIVHPRDTEMKTPWDSYPRDVTAYLEKVNPEYQTYQFVVKAYPTTTSGWKRGFEDALESEKNKVADIEEKLKRTKKELIFLKSEAAGFEAEISKRQKEYLRDLDKETARLEGEKSEIHKGYKAQIAGMEQEKAEIHKGYTDRIAEIEQEKAEIRKAYKVQENRLHGEIKGLQLEATHFRKGTVRLPEDLTRAEQEKRVLEGKIAGQRERLHEIETSLAWHLITRHRRLVERWLPQNTRRRRFYRLCLLAPIVLFKEGPLSFFRKIAARLPGVRKLVQGMGSKGRSGKTWHALSFPHFDKKKVTIIIPVYNQCKHTFRCLESILKNSTVPYEVIVVDNASDENTAQMLDAMEGIRVIHNEENQGFVSACHQGTEKGEGENYLFLNNDTEVTQGWIEAMLSPLEAKKAGIVGAKLIYPDGRLQEAGNIIWQDGTGWNYGRGDNPDLPQYSYLKEVDYCSGACLLVKKDLWNDLGGFDRRYAPAYYEDTDLCLAARQMGYKVIYQPEARVIHWEGLSAGTNIDKGYKRYQQINLEKFREKWREVLSKEHYQGPDELYPARERGFEKRVLVVDHYVPTFDMDSGSLRMFNLIKIFMELGYKVIFWPENKTFHEFYTRELQRIGVEVLYGEIDFEEYLKSYGKHIDLIFLSRPHVAMNFICAARKLTNARIIYDTVDLHFLREGRRAKIEMEKVSRHYKDMELFLAHQADDVLVVSDVEKQILEKEGLEGKVSIISNIHAAEKTYRPFDQRKGLMFIGGFEHLPNEDGIVWFVKSILPLIREKLPGIPLFIVGSRPTETVKGLSSKNITVTGYVEDVRPYFEEARVFVCPLRYGAGVKGKIGQSMAYGLPVVMTTVGAEGIDLVDGRDALIADDEHDFAEKVARLYQNRALWESLSLSGIELIEKKFSPQVVKYALRDLLHVREISV
jgi:GT2 family glycosyltransferase/glycosyltransferase involved in cell wall biosynthesis/2-polyprenyl-3-methyl-5-hydroxy-6-metoxy-1,4-benzoquinol methylase